MAEGQATTYLKRVRDKLKKLGREPGKATKKNQPKKMKVRNQPKKVKVRKVKVFRGLKE